MDTKKLVETAGQVRSLPVKECDNPGCTCGTKGQCPAEGACEDADGCSVWQEESLLRGKLQSAMESARAEDPENFALGEASKHFPFKVKRHLGPGPRHGNNEYTGKWMCKCSGYTCVCRNSEGGKKTVKIDPAYKAAYNKEYKAWSRKHGKKGAEKGASTGSGTKKKSLRDRVKALAGRAREAIGKAKSWAKKKIKGHESFDHTLPILQEAQDLRLALEAYTPEHTYYWGSLREDTKHSHTAFNTSRVSSLLGKSTKYRKPSRTYNPDLAIGKRPWEKKKKEDLEDIKGKAKELEGVKGKGVNAAIPVLQAYLARLPAGSSVALTDVFRDKRFLGYHFGDVLKAAYKVPGFTFDGKDFRKEDDKK